MTILQRLGVAALAAVALASGGAGAQGYPNRPITLICPWPAGGPTDTHLRKLSELASKHLGQPIIVENKPGAAGVIGATAAAKAAPDGQTWMVTFDSHILSPAFGSNLPYKDSDLFNVMLFGRAPLVITCHPDRPYRNFSEAMADARTRPGRVSMGMLSNSQSLLLMTYVKKANDFDMNLIFYKGGGPIVQDGVAGVTDLSITTLVSATPQIAAGKLRALATTGEKRSVALPDTSTLAEQGTRTYPTYSWWGIYAPTGTPRPVIDRMHAELTKAVRSPDVTRKFVDQIHLEIDASTPEEFAAFQKSEQERWFKVIKDNDIKSD
jgi:tripartite-type tricarboxylate transporter receptor subunit TctC